MFGSRSRRQAAAALAATVAERDAFLLQRDIALGERNELRRQLDEMTGERNEFRRQLDAALMTQAQGIRRSTREPEPSPSPQRSLFMASLPKSGTEFVGGAIRDATKLVSPMSIGTMRSAAPIFPATVIGKMSSRRACSYPSGFCWTHSAG